MCFSPLSIQGETEGAGFVFSGEKEIRDDQLIVFNLLLVARLPKFACGKLG